MESFIPITSPSVRCLVMDISGRFAAGAGWAALLAAARFAPTLPDCVCPLSGPPLPPARCCQLG
eukprot:1060669-Rhodomonas_salina.1